MTRTVVGTGSTDSRESVIEPATVADQLAFEGWPEESRRIARCVVRDELEEEIYDDLDFDHDELIEARDKLAEANRQVASVRKALMEVRDLVGEMQDKSRRGWVKIAEDVSKKVEEAMAE